MTVIFKVVRARNKKYNGIVLTIENCEKVADSIWFNSLEFNGKLYNGRISSDRESATLHSGRKSTIQFDEIYILN
jgi:hypothetical protein